MRILAIADEIDRGLTVARMRAMQVDLVVSCGDLPFEYLEFVMGAMNKPLFYVPGNHDPEVAHRDPFINSGFAGGPMLRLPDHEALWGPGPGPEGGINLDGEVVEHKGLRIAGLGGSIRYRPEVANQYTEKEMQRRVRKLIRAAGRPRYRRRRPIDLLVTHSPPLGVGDMPDEAHRGFESFHALIDRLGPKLMVHGHIHPHGFDKPDREIGPTLIANVIPHRILEVNP